MSNSNLWDSVKKTDPAHTKDVSQKGGYTAIDAYYLIERATELFGPYGIGWGLRESYIDMSKVELCGIAIHQATFFYFHNQEMGQFPIHNAISIKGKYGVDADFAKKLETNTISKALSRLGFAADVFTGQFEDDEYLEQINNEFALEKADDKDAERAKQIDEYLDWKANNIKCLSDAVSEHEAKKLKTLIGRKMSRHQDQTGLRELEATFKTTIDRLNEEKHDEAI